MEDRKERNAPWLSVPQFGDWDQKGQLPDYSLDFSKIREMRKQNRMDLSWPKPPTMRKVPILITTTLLLQGGVSSAISTVV